MLVIVSEDLDFSFAF